MNLEGKMANSFLREEVIHLVVIIMIMVDMTVSMKKIYFYRDEKIQCKAAFTRPTRGATRALQR